MNIEMTKMAESLDTVHTHTHTIPKFTNTYSSKETQYVNIQTCNKIQVKFNIPKNMKLK